MSAMSKGYLRCGNRRCGWIGTGGEVLAAPDPFDPEGDPLTACPLCREVNNIRTCCDEPECFEQDTCGFPAELGYRRTCGKHYREHLDRAKQA